MDDLQTPDIPRPPYGIAALVGGLALALYAATIAPTTQFCPSTLYINPEPVR